MSILEFVRIVRISVYTDLGPVKQDARRKIINFNGTKTSRSLMVSQLVNKTMNLILDVWTCILGGWLAGWLARGGFTMDLEGISVILGLGCRIPCGGKLWPLYTTMLGPWGLQAGRMVSGRLAGWLDGWMEG